MSNKFSILLIMTVGFVIVSASSALYAGGLSQANAHHFWNPYSVVGQTTLYRHDDGLKARIKINASATLASAAATTMINNTIICPPQSLLKRLQATKLREIPCNIISAERNITIMLRRTSSPITPSPKIMPPITI